jgi:o-succinylbenzoate---CoA ligase
MVRDSFSLGRPSGRFVHEDPTGSSGASRPLDREGWSGPETTRCQGAGVALIDAAAPSDPWDYDRLWERARRRAERLRTQGLRPGQIVAVPARSGLDLPLMQHALDLNQSALLPIQDDRFARLDSLLAVTGAEWTWCDEGPGEGRLVATGHATARPSIGDAWPSPLALLVETSGSAGVPRAVMLTAQNLRSSAALVNRYLVLGAGDCWLCCLPLRHIGGLTIPYRCALAGAAVVLRQGFQAVEVAGDLERHGVTHVSLVPPMLARLLALGRPPPPQLRVVLVGGQSLSPSLAQRALETGWSLRVTYGMTETASQVACSEALVAAPEGGAVGRPLPGVELDCPDCPGPPGVLRVRGPQVMAGYANPARHPGQGLEDGWLRTSDLACLDPDGVLRIFGRADEVVVTGGVKVHPGKVEARLARAPGVGELAVAGVADPVWGRRLVALYTGPASPADLDAWCRRHLSGPERPRGFARLPELPTLDSGKWDRRRLQELAAGALGAESIGEENSSAHESE